MPDQKDTVLGRLAVERGYLTQEQIDEAREAQRVMQEQLGVDQPLIQVLVGKHLLTADQAQELRHAVAIQTGEARLVAGYEVISKLGQGGMGAVYKARHLTTSRLVALKVLPPSLADKELIARFEREAMIVQKLDHANIVGCVEFGYDQKRKVHFCALELVEGEDLGKRLERLGGRALAEDEAVSITSQIAMALQHAFYNGLVHRDVKPENIMVTADGTAKLLDLGLARPASAEATRMTESGMFVGSPYYASPEQALGEREIDTRADIYSLGATLYHMVTGRPPFEGTTALAILQKHVNEKLAWPAEVNPELSDGLCMIIAKMMEKSPEDRYQTPNDLNRDLDLLMEGNEPEAGDAALKNSSVKVPAVRPGRRRRPAARARRAKERDRKHREPAGRRRRDSARERRREVEPKARGKPSGLSALPAGAKIAIGAGALGLVVVIGLVMFLGRSEPDRRPPKRGSSRDTLRTQPDKVTPESVPPGAGRPTVEARKVPPPVPSAADVDTAGPPPTLTLDLGGGVKMEFVYIKPGRFMMGSNERDEEKPVHEVAIANGFYLGKYEVTQSQYERVMEKNPSHFKGSNLPAEQVSWNDATKFCRKLSQQMGRAVRLPTEAEWEYACRAGSTTRFCFGDSGHCLGEYAWYGSNSGRTTHPVGGKRANAWGLHDMHGNVCEWCSDWYDKGYYAKSLGHDPAGPASGSSRVWRGGSLGGSVALCRSARRYYQRPTDGGRHLGFRAVVSAVPQAVSASQQAAYEKAMSLAKIRIKLKNWKGAVEALEEALAAKPDDAEAEKLLAEARGHKEPVPTLTLDLGGGVTMEMVYIKPGVFTMGGPDDAKLHTQGVERPKHEVAITRGFYVGRYEVTRDQFAAFVKATGYKTQGERKGESWGRRRDGTWGEIAGASWSDPVVFSQTDDHPVTCVTWSDAKAFCDWAAARTRRDVRLQTEAEWEYACRAGSTGRWCFGDKEVVLGEYAWLSVNSGHATHPVGKKRPNAWGVYDMHGNVWEWVADRYDPKYYATSPREDPSGPQKGRNLARGGCFDTGHYYCRSAFRFCSHFWTFRSTRIGFRACVSASPRGTKAVDIPKPYPNEPDSLRVGLVGHWTFDEGTGTTARDSSGRGNHGEIKGGPEWAKGKIGGALEFDKRDHIVVVANESAFDFYDAITVSCWVKARGGWARVWQAFVAKRGESDQGWQLRRGGNTNKICFTLRGTSASDDNAGADTTIGSDGLWHHIVGIFDGSRRKMYLDGALYQDIADTGTIAATDDPVTIGGRANGGTPVFHRGHIDAVRIYDRALSAAEVKALYEFRGAEAGASASKPAPGAPLPTLTLDLGQGVKMEFVYIKPGVFMMGGNENPKLRLPDVWQGVEKPKHEVAITRGFYIGKYEVTRGQFAAFVKATGYRTEAEKEGKSWGRRRNGSWGEIPGASWRDPMVFAQEDTHPVMCVSWNDVKASCDWAAARTRRGVRLPTEAEWEYACRAGTTTRFSFGDSEGALGEHAWIDRNSYWQTHPVGQKKPNAWGLYDVHGNVWEWVADWYATDYYVKSPRENPTGPDAAARRLLRGGCWHDYGPFECRSAIRIHGTPSYRNPYLGFRACVSASPRAK